MTASTSQARASPAPRTANPGTGSRSRSGRASSRSCRCSPPLVRSRSRRPAAPRSSDRGTPMTAMRARRRRSGGQILFVFVLAMMVMIAMVGLAIDGGGAYAQRRDQQTAADLAALAGANDYLLSNNSTQAIDRARPVASTNSFTNGSASTSVGVTVDTSNGVQVEVAINSPHRNSFLAAVGMSTWNISTSATALAGFPDSANGAGPFIF